MLLLELPIDLIHRILVWSWQVLGVAEQTCSLLRAAVREDDALWRQQVRSLWGWLVPDVATLRSWKWQFARLHTQSHCQFCVIGGARIDDLLTSWPTGYALGYQLRDETWTDIPVPQEERNMPGITRDTEGGLVAIGGISQTTALRSVERFDPDVRAWTHLPELSVPRCCCGAASNSDGSVYAVGGGESMYRGARAWSSVERYDLSQRCWLPAPSLLEPRCAPGVALHHGSAHLYAAGGYAGQGRYLETVERLDLSRGSQERWERLPPLSCKRSGANAAVGPDYRIYVLGGGPDGNVAHRSMEAFDPREGIWDCSLASLRVARHYNAAAFGPDGRLYVAGTYEHTGQLAVVERYDIRADQWETLADMPRPVQFSAGVFLF
eukprot:TRINITY_DN66369_c0_g1_i1.p1 TRINITY_DN66369_c0_g1~~TRINITY_DN66369_c0_g1_i1.p1  ORF type:complete len:380 (-),score=29.77 TRINITY_DN66369_c0_g1_i1:191-1330(-)